MPCQGMQKRTRPSRVFGMSMPESPGRNERSRRMCEPLEQRTIEGASGSTMRRIESVQTPVQLKIMRVRMRQDSPVSLSVAVRD